MHLRHIMSILSTRSQRMTRPKISGISPHRIAKVSHPTVYVNRCGKRRCVPFLVGHVLPPGVEVVASEGNPNGLRKGKA